MNLFSITVVIATFVLGILLGMLLNLGFMLENPERECQSFYVMTPSPITPGVTYGGQIELCGYDLEWDAQEMSRPRDLTIETS